MAGSSGATGITPLEAEEFLREMRLMRGVDDPNNFYYENVKDLNTSLDM
jgi:hypothetical protein